jgi:hypothetical protein
MRDARRVFVRVTAAGMELSAESNSGRYFMPDDRGSDILLGRDDVMAAADALMSLLAPVGGA